ncbi:hypothetical protein [Desulfopila aestuarii]|uniref:Uncharacterized protein n=1 Tax=Desulfopila aestuarii DSM 18488 TaxID=1121416 RepID=A0A1M7XYL0_9BACT|nr:hypothetical protein [Desulfopila aestuarii]SHO44150.1 hypothetical protein SAMN02745220_00671 [Desulfopila aestuarii DSM 18488]
MEIKDFDQAMKQHKEISTALMARIEKIRKEKPPTTAVTIKEQGKRVAQAKRELTAVKKEMDLVVASLNKKIQSRSKTVERLEHELQEMKEKVKEQEKIKKK